MGSHHYYEENQEGLHSNPEVFDFYFKNIHFKFHTDDGVFSKSYIDYGSFALLSAFALNKVEGPILDMGAGYGALGISIAKLYEREVVMCEINERAYHLIKQNILENKANNCSCYQGNLYEPLPKDMTFSMVVTNPPIRAGKEVVFQIYEGAFKVLKIGGEIWVVIQKKQGAPSSKAHLEKIFGNCEIIDRNKGYYILRSVKME